MKAVLSAALMLALPACSQPAGSGDTAASPVASSPASAPRVTRTPSAAAPILLAGEYRVAGVDGRDIDQPYAITASITPARIHVTADCLNFGWTYTLAGDSIATERLAVESCGRGPTPAEEAVVAAVDAAARIARTPANGVELVGQGRRLTLFSQ